MKTKKATAKKATAKSGSSKITLISARAKEIRVKQPKLKWTDCIKKASQELKKEAAI